MSVPEPRDVHNFRKFEKELGRFQHRLENDGYENAEIVYRGLADGLDLTTTLERAVDNWHLTTSDKSKIERQLIRDFRRGYQGSDVERVLADTCYCLALMQHHGAPTRMLDWTYSPYVAAKFALDKRQIHGGNGDTTHGIVWCLNAKWLRRAAGEIVENRRLRQWNYKRDEKRFRRLFMPNKPPKNFVYSANPFNLNERLRVQQGVFLCQGNIAETFIGNLQNMDGVAKNTCRIRLALSGNALHQFSQNLWRMNVNSATLSPGLDGYARSLGENPRVFTGNTNTNRN